MLTWFSAQSSTQEILLQGSYFQKAHGHIFISPNFLKKEILKHNERILKITQYETEDLEAIESSIYHRIEFYAGKLISQECSNHANAIMKDETKKIFPIWPWPFFLKAKFGLEIRHQERI